VIDQCCHRLRAEVHATKAKAQGPDEKVVRLTEMGFDAQAAQAALFSANGDEQVIEHEGAETVATI
jgi:UBA/TS-N domain